MPLSPNTLQMPANMGDPEEMLRLLAALMAQSQGPGGVAHQMANTGTDIFGSLLKRRLGQSSGNGGYPGEGE